VDDAIAWPTLRPARFRGAAGAWWTWRWMERAHAPGWRDHPATLPHGAADPVADGWITSVARERARLARLDREELGPRSGSMRAQARAAASNARRRTLARLERAMRGLELARFRAGAAAPAPELDRERLLAALAPGETLLEYHVGRTGLWALRVRAGTP